MQDLSKTDVLDIWLARGILFLAFCVPVAVAISRILYPFDSGFHESVTWAPSQLVASGQNPYDFSLTTHPPYVMAPYGPIYYLVIGAGIKCFGLQFWFGRSVSLVALIISCWCIYRLIGCAIKESPAKNQLCCLGVATFLAQLPVVYWIGMHRPDFLSLALLLCGLCLIEPRNEFPVTTRHFVGAAVCFSAAVLCRQTAFLPIFFVLFWNRRNDRRGAVWLLGVFSFVVAAVCLFLQWTSHGGFVELLWKLPSATVRSVDGSIAVSKVLFIAPVAIMVLLLALFAGRLGTSSGEIKNHLLRWQGYFAVASFLAFVTSGRAGATVSYWLEPCAVGAVIVPLAFAHHGLGPRLRLLGFTVVLTSSLLTGLLMQRDEQMRWRQLPYIQHAVAVVRKYVPQNEPISARYVDWVVAAGRTPWFNDIFQYKSSTYHRRIYDEVVRSKRLGAFLQPGPVPAGYHRIGDPNFPKGFYLDVREDLYLRKVSPKTKTYGVLKPRGVFHREKSSSN